MTYTNWKHSNPASTPATDLQINSLQIGSGSTYLEFYNTEGDIYSDTGSAYIGGGLTLLPLQYGVGAMVRNFNPSRTIDYAINATFTASSKSISKTGETFVSDGVTTNDFVVVTSSDPDYAGAMGAIESVTEETITVLFASAGGDAVVDATSMNFRVLSDVVMLSTDNGYHYFEIGADADAHFHIKNSFGNNDRAVFIEDKAAVNGHTMMDIEIDADVYSGVSALVIDFDASGFDASDDVGTVLDIAIQNIGATDGDLHVLDVAVSDPTNTDLEVEAIATHQGVDVIAQYLGDPAALATGWSEDSGVFTDRTAAFNAAGTDVQIFTADDDRIYVASATKFDDINVALAVTASHTIIPTFEYSVDDGSWVAFSPADDTEGFSLSATIRFSSSTLTTWGQRTINEVTGEVGAVDYYWIRITRTRGVLPTPPTEDTIQVTAVSGKFGWDKNALLTIQVYTQADEPTTAQLGAGKMCWWIDSDDDALRLCYNQAGTVKTTAALT